ncbi:MAG: hypothetical protein LLG04_07900 [Parachlamydia sp.]|nr:hypothetical protein [Parachlamydia sp.]
MIKQCLTIALAAFLLICCTVFAQEEDCLSPHRFSLGPEVYTLKREREGGTHQRGTLIGVRAIYDYIVPRKFYVGFEGSAGTGTLKGRSGGGEQLRSHFTESMVEGRLGYTLKSCSGCCGWFTPFVGGGYFWEDNDYIHPSPKHLHFRNRFGYFAVGCLSRICPLPRFYVGLNVTARFSMKGEVHVSHDPEGEPVTLKYEQKVNCRIVLPLSYFCQCSEFCLAPFYEYRHYGRRLAFPFDFLDTRIKSFGVELLWVYKF